MPCNGSGFYFAHVYVHVSVLVSELYKALVGFGVSTRAIGTSTPKILIARHSFAFTTCIKGLQKIFVVSFDRLAEALV